MVAAWINALTGVGPSMASGNHTWRGNCADLPAAPQKMSRPITVDHCPKPEGFAASQERMSAKEIAPESCQTNRIPSRKPKSPNRFVRKAFLQASAAEGRSY